MLNSEEISSVLMLHISNFCKHPNESLKPRVRDKRLYGTGTSILMLIIPKWNLCACEFPVSVRD